MIISIRQTKRDLSAAGFTIVGEDGALMGRASFTGSLTSRDGQWRIWVGQNAFRMDRISEREGRSLAEGSSRTMVMRPYRIQAEGEPSAPGVIFMDEVKTGLISRMSLHTMYWKGLAFEKYLIGLGKQGMVYPIYLGEFHQIAEARRPCRIEDMLYQYQMFCPDECYLIPSILHVLYLYAVADYVTGEKVTHSVETKVKVTKDRKTLEKYHPEFWPC